MFQKRNHIARASGTSTTCSIGYRDFAWPWTFRLSRLLFTRSWLSNERPGQLFDLATSWLLQNKILLPGVTTLTRLISEIRKKSADRLWSRLSGLASGEQCSLLEELLQVPDGVRTSRFEQLRKRSCCHQRPAFNQAVARYLKLKAFGMQDLLYRYSSSPFQCTRTVC
ncbi:DUF4158 domain-containing protein [Providencia hangzhouensis]|uniref:DUF4158 domain-containing protein n=1 Tax=Providencia hangzhouensis TaxID=3031799 RepID=UPI00397A48C6